LVHTNKDVEAVHSMVHVSWSPGSHFSLSSMAVTTIMMVHDGSIDMSIAHIEVNRCVEIVGYPIQAATV
jgi:hypothetical protein